MCKTIDMLRKLVLFSLFKFHLVWCIVSNAEIIIHFICTKMFKYFWSPLHMSLKKVINVSSMRAHVMKAILVFLHSTSPITYPNWNSASRRGASQIHSIKKKIQSIQWAENWKSFSLKLGEGLQSLLSDSAGLGLPSHLYSPPHARFSAAPPLCVFPHAFLPIRHFF